MFGRIAYRLPLAALIATLCFAAPARLGAQAAPAAVPSAPTLQGGAFGQTVALTWTPAAGATSYMVGVGVQSNVYQLVQSVGNTLALTVAAPPGVYFVRVAGVNAEGLGTPSNEITVAVGPASGAPPPAPSGLQAQVSGQTASLTWQLGQGGGQTSALVFAVGNAPGAYNLGFFPLNVTTSASRTMPEGTYFARLYAAGPGGISAPSNELTVTIAPAPCGAPAATTLSATVDGRNVLLAWNAVAGVAGYRLDVSSTPGGALILSQGFAAGTTSLAAPGIAPGTYYAKLASISPCGAEAMSQEIAIVVTAPAGGGRTPDPPPGQILPLPDMSDIVDEIARNYPHELRNSCGDNTWLFRLVNRLREIDTRWGLNWKRARPGDMSQDVVDYHYGSGPDEGSYDTYVVDVIGGHCGGNPGPAFHDVTVFPNNRNAIWTIQPLR